MGTINILSTEELIKAAAIPSRKTKEISWNKKNIVVKEILSLQEYLRLIDRIKKESENGEGSLRYETIDFITRANIIAAYSFIDLPKDIQQLYNIIYYTDLYDTIVRCVCSAQLHNVLEAVYLYTGVGSGGYEPC